MLIIIKCKIKNKIKQLNSIWTPQLFNNQHLSVDEVLYRRIILK